MQEELRLLNVNRKRLSFSFILMLIFFIITIGGMVLGNYVDSTYNMLKENSKNTNIVHVIFGLPFVITILCSYMFFFLYIQAYYNILIKLSINKPNKYWLFFYVSFFIPIIKNFIPFIGILYLIWNFVNVKKRIVVGFIYLFPLIFNTVLVFTGIYSKIKNKFTDKIMFTEIENNLTILIIWSCTLIVLLIMNKEILKEIKKNEEINLTTAST